MSENLIISHGDGDGLCACAITYRALGGDADVYFAQPFDLHKLLKKLMDDGTIYRYHEIYIVDIAYTKKTKAILKKLVNKAKPRNYIYYIDHHKSSIPIEDDIPQCRSVINTNFSASELCAFYFSQLTLLARIGSASDKITMLSKIDALYAEVETLRKALAVVGIDDEFRMRVMKRLSQGKMPTEIGEVVDKAKICDSEREGYMDIAWNSIVYEDDNVVIINANGHDMQGHAGSIASEISIHKKKMAFLIYGKDKTIVTGRSHNRIEVDVGEFMRKYLSGGGHKNAGSSTFYGHIDDLIDCLPKWFNKEMELIRRR